MNLGGGASDADSEEGSGAAGTVSVHADTLVEECSGVNVAEQAGKGTVERSGVHITASLDDVGGGDDTRLVVLGGDTDESLLDDLVSEGLGLVEALDVLGNVGEKGRFGVAEVVVVEQTGVTLLDELAVGAEC